MYLPILTNSWLQTASEVKAKQPTMKAYMVYRTKLHDPYFQYQMEMIVQLHVFLQG